METRNGISGLTLNNLLYESAMEVLEGLGEETMQAILWQMSTQGVSCAPDTFDLHIFAVGMRDLFGHGAESILEEIYQNIVCRLETLEQTLSYNSFGNVGGGSTDCMSTSALQKIHSIIGITDGQRERKE